MENDDTVKTTDDGTGETELEGESKIVVEHEDKQDEEAEGVKKKSEEGKERDKDKSKEVLVKCCVFKSIVVFVFLMFCNFIVNIRLNAVGNAPILRQKLWAVPADREVGQIVEFVKKYLKLEKHQSLVSVENVEILNSGIIVVLG